MRVVNNITRGINRLGVNAGKPAGLPGALRNKFLFLWTGQYTGDNLKDSLGSAAVITVTGKDWTTRYIDPDTSATFAVPDNATFIGADGTDDFWFDAFDTLQQKTHAELIASETLRTFIKYADFEPYFVYGIGILKAGETLTEADKVKLNRYFKLWAEYWGVLMDSGYMKDNRTVDESWSSYWATRTPTGIILTVLSATSIKVDWTNSGTGYDGHKIERSDDLGATYSVIGSVTGDTKTFTDSELTAGTTYFYRVRAYKGTNYSNYATSAVGTTFATEISDGNSVIWGKYDDLSTIIKDENSKVTAWNDKLGGGNNLLQADPAKAPTYSATDGIRFNNASATFMKCAAFTLNQPEYIYMVCRINSAMAATTTKCIMDGNTSNRAIISGTGSGVNRRINAYSGTWSANNNQMNIGEWTILRCLFNGANSKIVLWDGTPVTGDFGANNMGGFTLGARGDNAQNADIDVKEFILRKTADDEATETAIYNYLKNKYFYWMDATDTATLSCGALSKVTTITISGHNAKYPVIIDWGDESYSFVTMDDTLKDITHQYPAIATYTVTFSNASNIKGLYLWDDAHNTMYGNLATLAGATSLEELAVANITGVHQWEGDVVNLAATLKVLYLGYNNNISGDIGRFNLRVLDMVSHATNQSTIGGSIEGSSDLEWFFPWGLNTISGNMNINTTPKLKNIYVGGFCSVVLDVTGMTELRSVEKEGFVTLGCPALFTGDISGLINIGLSVNNPVTGVLKKGWLCVADPNTLTGDISNLLNSVYLSATGNNTLYGSIDLLAELYAFYVNGNTITGNILNCLKLEAIMSANALTKPSTVASLKYLNTWAPGGGTWVFTETEVNQILADFWANRDEPKPENARTDRLIDLRGSAAPTGQGLTDAAALRLYRSPNNDAGEPLWEVLTES